MAIGVFYSCLLLSLLCLNCQACKDDERDALLKIKYSINSPEGTAFSSWYGEDCCQWEGVDCDASGTHVIKMFFHHRRDQNSLWYPNATLFAQFKELQELELPGNQIGGFISPSELNKLENLQKLNLRSNSIEDGSHICWGNIPSLYYLDLSSNKLKHFPECQCETLAIEELYLNDNLLEGNISPCLSNMTALKHLHLSDNLFSTHFPSMLIYNLTNLESLGLSRNQFKGMVSFSIFANLSRLFYLDISYNHLVVETESPTWYPTFNLNYLNLGGCKLNNIPGFISTQHHLQLLDLSYNLIEGILPSWLLYNVTEQLWIRGNYLTGGFPKAFQNRSSQLSGLDISNNNFSGPIPEDIGLIFTELNYFNASQNSFDGRLPASFGKMKQILLLDLSGNQFHGQIPYSITSNLSSLEHLVLSDNNLEGDALPKNSSLPNLRGLFLNRNHFSGNFPDCLGKSAELITVSIQQNRLYDELSSDFPVLPELRILLLGENQFEGQIPLQLCQMRHLRLLDLSRNGISGGIPNCINNITSWKDEVGRLDFQLDHWVSVHFVMLRIAFTFPSYFLPFITGIDVSCNKLTGTIPAQMGQLNLHVLNTSHNHLTGQIPATIGNMSQLESLDLSHNMLFGILPHELLALHSLQSFNVSFNNLSGVLLPQAGQFGTFDETSYVGNPGLCGPPLEKQCDEVEDMPSSSLPNHPRTTAYALLFWCTVLILLVG